MLEHFRVSPNPRKREKIHHHTCSRQSQSTLKEKYFTFRISLARDRARNGSTARRQTSIWADDVLSSPLSLFDKRSKIRFRERQVLVLFFSLRQCAGVVFKIKLLDIESKVDKN